MDLKTYIADPARRDALAASLGTSKQYLWQLAEAWQGRKGSAEMAKRIQSATNGEVPAYELRPDIWERPAEPTTQASTTEARAA